MEENSYYHGNFVVDLEEQWRYIPEVVGSNPTPLRVFLCLSRFPFCIPSSKQKGPRPQ